MVRNSLFPTASMTRGLTSCLHLQSVRRSRRNSTDWIRVSVDGRVDHTLRYLLAETENSRNVLDVVLNPTTYEEGEDDEEDDDDDDHHHGTPRSKAKADPATQPAPF